MIRLKLSKVLLIACVFVIAAGVISLLPQRENEVAYATNDYEIRIHQDNNTTYWVTTSGISATQATIAQGATLNFDQ